MASWRLRVLRLATPQLLVFALMGCGSATADTSGLLTWDQMNTEYRNMVESFPFALPSGVSFPGSAPAPMGQDEQLYETGVGGMQAYFFYKCAEEDIALTYQTSDTQRAEKALDALVGLTKDGFWNQHVLDADGEYVELVNQARLGDYSVLADLHSNGCSSDWLQGKAG